MGERLRRGGLTGKGLFPGEGANRIPSGHHLGPGSCRVPSPPWRLTPRLSFKSSIRLQDTSGGLTEPGSLGSQVRPFHPGRLAESQLLLQNSKEGLAFCLADLEGVVGDSGRESLSPTEVRASWQAELHRDPRDRGKGMAGVAVGATCPGFQVQAARGLLTAWVEKRDHRTGAVSVQEDSSLWRQTGLNWNSSSNTYGLCDLRAQGP